MPDIEKPGDISFWDCFCPTKFSRWHEARLVAEQAAAAKAKPKEAAEPAPPKSDNPR